MDNYRGGVCLFPMYRITLYQYTGFLQFVAGSIVLWGVPFLHAPVRQRLGLGLGPMRGQGTKARRAAGREWYPRSWGGGGRLNKISLVLAIEQDRRVLSFV